ncbi:FAD-binding and (Fe-S)-binding domain-containing protein [Telmatospirillum siberiense]|uniref:D-lactate dehydrogenase (cytochrome) n=1 Tax=Telmatospirillum siberiense TaxID=382514 RepID=A0A2N3Q1Q6_9PROT|nr:FAD-binding and (Fe-S)-binding domain-containing protein [Telmatospirillum siberiense]PKU26583.1 4Fe-4S ferredoxin [Telmatospirillum siberiense]
MAESSSLAKGLPTPFDVFVTRLAEALPRERIITDPLRRLAWGTDASFYRLIPQVVVLVESEEEVRSLLTLCHRFRLGITFRAAGTSLSGQAVSDSVLAVLGEGWNGSTIEADGTRIRLQPGVIGTSANRRLAPFGRKIGPDPASIDSCKIGGIAANNASGMCCGTAQNSYRTLDSLRVVLADGAVLDTGDEASRQTFAKSHASLLAGLTDLARRTSGDEALSARIRRKFKIKNTIGYSLNALIDFDDPIDILAHLMIGSEGTLGFISAITYRTVPDHPHRASGLAVFPDMESACRTVVALKATPVSAVEMLDRPSLRSVESKPGMPPYIRTLPDAASALLIEIRGETPEHLAANLALVKAVLDDAQPSIPADLTTDREEIERQWAIRRGMLPTVGALRPGGTTVVTEDIAVPLDHLAEAAHDLRQVLNAHGYEDALIFGHALEGNLHFIFTQDFNKASEVERYGRLMDGIAEVVAGRYDGSLKAEHGTGRAMAPFVEIEWGAQAFALIREIKSLFDPSGLLNPGVILSDDRQAHIHDLKPLPPAFPAIDKCIECGLCERLCPSAGLTLTPRHRIVGWREITRRERAGENADEIRRLYDYHGIDTCAACGLCSMVCPVGINTAVLTKALRGRRHGAATRWLAGRAGRHFGLVTRALRGGLLTARASRRALGAKVIEDLSHALRRLAGPGSPVALAAMPNAGSGSPRPLSRGGRERVVYVSACPSRTMGPSDRGGDGRFLPDVVIGLLDKAGFDVVVPEGLDALCCGLSFESKGLEEEAGRKGEEMALAILAASENGRLSVVMDASPCSLRMKGILEGRATLHDLPEFLHDEVLPRLTVDRQDRPVLLHLPCSVKRMGGQDKLRRLAEACSSRVSVPEEVTCCGFAGDKGFFRPELNDHALRHLTDGAPPDFVGCSSSRTCEIGLEQHSGASFQSIAYLLDACSRSKD